MSYENSNENAFAEAIVTNINGYVVE